MVLLVFLLIMLSDGGDSFDDGVSDGVGDEFGGGDNLFSAMDLVVEFVAELGEA